MPGARPKGRNSLPPRSLSRKNLCSSELRILWQSTPPKNREAECAPSLTELPLLTPNGNVQLERPRRGVFLPPTPFPLTWPLLGVCHNPFFSGVGSFPSCPSVGPFARHSHSNKCHLGRPSDVAHKSTLRKKNGGRDVGRDRASFEEDLDDLLLATVGRETQWRVASVPGHPLPPLGAQRGCGRTPQDSSPQAFT